MEVINSLPSESAENPYIIRLKDGFEAEVSSMTVRNAVSFECWKDSINDKLGTATLKWTGTSGSMFSVGNGASLTIEGVKSAGDNPSWSGLVLDGNKEADKTGQGITIAYGGTLQMKGGEIRNFSYTSEGAGVAINGSSASFVMTGGKISGNETSSRGGGVFVESGSAGFQMCGGRIAGNKATGTGGGVENNGKMYVYGSAVIGDDTKDTPASAAEGQHSNIASAGGGIYLAANNVVLYLGFKPGETEESEPVPEEFTGGIYYNYAESTTLGGGGIGVNIGNVYINGGTIACNGAKKDGGGLYAKGSEWVLSGSAVVKKNSADGFGDGVYVNVFSSGSFSIKGSAYIASDNDVYLPSGKKILIAGALTPPAAANGKVATITPASYTSTNPWIELSTDPAPDPTTTLAAECGKFAVTPQAGSSDQWKITPDGKLHKIVSVADASGLQTALNSGDAISISSNIAITGGFSGTESQNLSIEGSGANRLKMESSTNDIVFQYIDFANGKINTDGQEGGMLSLKGNGSNSLTIKNCSFTDCSAVNRNTTGNNGGALYIEGFKTVTIEDCEFYANGGNGSNKSHLATSGGFIYLSTPEGATVNINRCSFTGGYASHGGAIALLLDYEDEGTVTESSTMTIDSCTFTKNHADWNGGAIDFSYGSAITINNSTFTDNAVDDFSGETNSANVYLQAGQSVNLTGGCEINGAVTSEQKGSSF